MEFISTSDPYLWSAVSVEAAMEEVSPAKKICLSPAQIPDSTTTEMQDLNKSILALAEGQILILENEPEPNIDSSVANPMLPNIRGHLLDHPKMIKKDGRYRIERSGNPPNVTIQYALDEPYSGDVLVGVVHTNIKYREHVIGEEVNQFPVRAMGNGGISRQEIVYLENYANNLKIYGSICKLINADHINLEFTLISTYNNNKSQAFRETELLILPINLDFCDWEPDCIRKIPNEFIQKRQMPPIDIQVMALVKEDRLNNLKKNRENQPKERFPSEPSQGNEDRQKVLAVLNEQLDRISGEEMRQLLEFLKQNEDRNIFQDLENNN